MKQRRKSTTPTFFAAILCGLVATTTFAQGPPEDSDVSFTVVGFCAFPVLVELTGKSKVINLSGGRAIITSPGLVTTLTNLDDPAKQEVLGITGAFHETFFENGDLATVVTGRNLVIGLDPDAAFVLAIGTFSFVFDAEFNIVQPFAGNGRIINICELLE